MVCSRVCVNSSYYTRIHIKNHVCTVFDEKHIGLLPLLCDNKKKTIKPKIIIGLKLKIFDAYRPQRAVDDFVQWAKSLNDTTMKKTYYPKVSKALLFEHGYIASRSGHTRGSTVDLTLIDSTGKKLDMGTPWDFFSPKSWPSSQAVPEQAQRNRAFLRQIMQRHGFIPYEAEWWHFTLEYEPFPNTYFDFPIQ